MHTNKIIALAGNPNVGKSTVFNALTGLKQHTGNWSGKTVTNAKGTFSFEEMEYTLVDLPGCYSLTTHSMEEEVARDYIYSNQADAIIVVCDATCLERNMNLVLQTMAITPNVVICVNLIDEAEKKKISIDLKGISDKLGVPVIGTSARNKIGLDALIKSVSQIIQKPQTQHSIKNPKTENTSIFIKAAEDICKDTVFFEDCNYKNNDLKIDRILSGKWTAFPIMFFALLMIFWLTITGANYPSQLINTFLFRIENLLLKFFILIETPPFFYEILIFGVYRVLAWVVSVMLPPMAIFFPLFALLEDAGFLPRIAFNLDRCFKKCNACGKQALTMCMGFGCNAAGIIGCRIIDSPRERLIAIITNNFVPCNGRFPTLIAFLSMFFIHTTSGFKASLLSSLLLTCFILLGVIMTLVVSNILSKTILKGIPSSFALELPPYRRPQFGKVILRSLLDKTLYVLGRSIVVAAPAGFILWLMANISISDMTLLGHCSEFLDPFAKLLGMDGVILLAFILGFPANEIVIPIIIMAYMEHGSLMEISNLSVLKQLLVDNGWTWITAVSVMLFSLMHWPCSTTCLTIKKETQSIKWTVISMVVPTIIGILICFIFTTVARGVGKILIL